MLTNATSKLLCLVVLVWCSQTQAQSQPGAVLMKHGGVLVGQVAVNGDSYSIVQGPGSKLQVPANKVEYVAPDIVGIYNYQLRDQHKWIVGDHARVMRWCLQHGLIDQAISHFAIVQRQLEPRHPLAARLDEELRARMLSDDGFRKFIGIAVPKQPNLMVAASSHQAEPARNANGVQPASAQITHTENAVVAKLFNDAVQPILLNRCGQAACHGGMSPAEFRLIKPYAAQHAEITRRNMQSALAFVATDSKEKSALLSKAVTAHASQRSPSFTTRDARLLRRLSNWITAVQQPVVTAAATVPAEIHQRAADSTVTNAVAQRQTNGVFQPYSSAVMLMPVSPGSSGLRQVPGKNSHDVGAGSGGFPAGDAPTVEEIDALDRELSRMLGESPAAIQAGEAKQDAFDPEEFNRQSHLRN